MASTPLRLPRREFIGFAGATALGLLARSSSLAEPGGQDADTGEFLFLEAEAFADRGGWELDQQSMDQMGSPTCSPTAWVFRSPTPRPT
ncbi:MAG: hypothetical protein R3C10_04095 [Pirellulales bacterium]